jgi:hypothetical protein
MLSEMVAQIEAALPHVRHLNPQVTVSTERGPDLQAFPVGKWLSALLAERRELRDALGKIARLSYDEDSITYAVTVAGRALAQPAGGEG